MTETYSRADMDRATEAAFSNALAEVDGDLQPFGHGRRQRCCTPCSVLANVTAKFIDGCYPWSAPPTLDALEAVEDSRTVGTAARRAPHPRDRLAG